MGRKNRGSLLYDGCYAHVMSRAIERRHVFRSQKDFEYFKELLLESKRRHGYRIHHYCLMHTHIHLVVSLDRVDFFSEGLKWVKWKYARHFNLNDKRFGPLWRDRFKSRVIEDERYLRACGTYVEGNPVDAGLVKRCEDWPYSSSRHYFCGEEDPLVDDYSFDGALPEVEGGGKDLFEKAEVIGSEMFKIHYEEGLFHGMPVPD